MRYSNAQIVDADWITFPGGELEGKRPKSLCPACRERLHHLALAAGRVRGQKSGANQSRPLCFQCYRAELDRDRVLRAARELGMASSARFQWTLPFEPVSKGRLEMLKAERATARAARPAGLGRFEERRRQAQIAARHALQEVTTRLAGSEITSDERRRTMAGAIRAAELQLPEAWLPFVVAR